MKKLFKFLLLVIFALFVLVFFLIFRDVYNKSDIKNKNSNQIKTELITEIEKLKNKN